jgi:hypothetical protein
MGDYLRRQPSPDDGALTLFVIYERPIDYPNGFVVRRHLVVPGGGIWVDPIAVGVATLEQARAELPDGVVNLGRQPTDHPSIKETWL